MEDTGSTTFVLFDRIVTQFIRRTVQDSISAAEKVIHLLLFMWNT